VGLFNFGRKSKLGIDVGMSSIKIVELSRESGRYKLENYGLFELESSVTAAGEKTAPVSDQDIIRGIKETLKRSKTKTLDAVASIPSFNTFATVITMPYLSEADIAKTIPYEARKYIPIPLNEVVLDWSIINVSPPSAGPVLPSEKVKKIKPPTVEIFIAAVPKGETQRYRAIMKEAGVNLRALELENSALIRALIGNDLSPAAVINIGGRSSSTLIVENGFERVSHNYEVGGFEITRSIARALNVSLQRAEELKRSLGLKSVDSNVITQAMSSLVDLIVFETKKIIHNYEDVKKTRIAKVFLVGGLANMPAFLEYFAARLGLSVSAGNPLARVISPPALEPLRKELNATLAVAIGLAMREI